MYRLRLGALVTAVLFVAYGAKEVLEAREHGEPASDGVEAIVIGAVAFGAFLLLSWVHRRNR